MSMSAEWKQKYEAHMVDLKAWQHRLAAKISDMDNLHTDLDAMLKQ
jgi:hypothetical protein